MLIKTIRFGGTFMPQPPFAVQYRLIKYEATGINYYHAYKGTCFVCSAASLLALTGENIVTISGSGIIALTCRLFSDGPLFPVMQWPITAKGQSPQTAPPAMLMLEDNYSFRLSIIGETPIIASRQKDRFVFHQSRREIACIQPAEPQDFDAFVFLPLMPLTTALILAFPMLYSCCP